MSKKYYLQLYKLAYQDYQLATSEEGRQSALDDMARLALLGESLYPGFYEEARAAAGQNERG